MRGRKPKPTGLKVIEGNPGKRPLNAREPKPRRGIPRCPAHLDAEAKREWKRITQELDACGLLTEVDRAALAAYCVLWSRWVKAEEMVRKTGDVLSAPSGALYQNPHLGIANRALSMMKVFLAEFGMTPSSRTRLHTQAPTGDDPFEAFLNASDAG